jgi:hypothetical protein
MNLLKTSPTIAVWFVILGAVSMVPAQSIAKAPISICEIAQYGHRETGNILRLHAVYVSDLVERTVLTDPQCPSTSVEVVLSTKSRPHESVEEFERAVRGDVVHDRAPREFYIDASVIYRWNKAAPSQVELMRVWNFHPVRK